MDILRCVHFDYVETTSHITHHVTALNLKSALGHVNTFINSCSEAGNLQFGHWLQFGRTMWRPVAMQNYVHQKGKKY